MDIEIPHLSPGVLRTFFIPGDQLTVEEKESIRISDELIKQLMACKVLKAPVDIGFVFIRAMHCGL